MERNNIYILLTGWSQMTFTHQTIEQATLVKSMELTLYFSSYYISWATIYASRLLLNFWRAHHITEEIINKNQPKHIVKGNMWLTAYTSQQENHVILMLQYFGWISISLCLCFLFFYFSDLSCQKVGKNQPAYIS